MQKLLKSVNHTGQTDLMYSTVISRASQQKGRIEKNYEYIQRFIPQGKSFDTMSQEDINRMMSHINSVKRDSLGEKSPFECLNRKYLNAIKKLGLKYISSDDVILKPSLF